MNDINNLSKSSNRRSDTVFMLVSAGLMTALVTIATMVIKIPMPGASGYVHMGDAMIFLSVLILGVRYGTLSAAIGSAIGDMIGGYAVWAPWTLGIKGLMAFAMGILLHIAFRKPQKSGYDKFIPLIYIPAMILGGIIMTGGYYVAESVMYENWLAPLVAIPWNVTQFVVGMVVAIFISAALLKTSARKIFAYKVTRDTGCEDPQ